MDEQNQGEMENQNPTENNEANTQVNVEAPERRSNTVATVAIILLVALLAYGVYAYLNRADEEVLPEGDLVEEVENNGDLQGGLDVEVEIPAGGDVVEEQ